jgi:regulator of RNase E activity RraA
MEQHMSIAIPDPALNSLSQKPVLSLPDLLSLRRWNTPTVYNGLEQYTKADRRTIVNLEEAVDFMPQMGAMVGYAVTLVIEPSNPEHPKRNPDAWVQFFNYVASIPGPKIVVCQDLDKPRTYGACFGEVNGSIYRTLGCVGGIVDGAIRDLDEMNYAGLKMLAKRLAVSHCYGSPVRWGCDVEVFGIPVRPGQLIHADKHGFLVVPEGEELGLPEASAFMDRNECQTLIPAARYTVGDAQTTAAALARAAAQFGTDAQGKFGRGGEWGGHKP